MVHTRRSVSISRNICHLCSLVNTALHLFNHGPYYNVWLIINGWTTNIISEDGAYYHGTSLN